MALLSISTEYLHSLNPRSAPVIALSLFIIFGLYFAQVRFRPGLRSIPGPFLASVTDLYRFFEFRGKNFHEKQLVLHLKHGTFVRYGPNLVSISDPDAVPIIYSANKGFLKSDFYLVSQVLAGGQTIQGMFDTLDESLHHVPTPAPVFIKASFRAIRKPVNHAYSLNTLLDYEPYVDSTLQVFTSQLTSLYAGTEKVCDLGEWLQWYSFDVVGELTFSKRLGFLDQAKDVDGITASIEKAVHSIGTFGQVPWLDPIIGKNPIWNWWTSSAPIAEFTYTRMQERLAEMETAKTQGTLTRKKDMLAKFIEARDADPENVPDYFVLSWANNNCYAGSDTTGISLRAVFYHLLKNPETLAKLRDEIDSVEHLASPVSWANTKKMPYLEACVKEALRIHPSLGGILERVVPKGGREICGKFFEEGTIVGMNAWVVQRDKGVFGDDADKWNPERWFAPEEQRKKMDRSMLVFGGGNRICIGKHVALLEMHKAVPELLRTFDIELAHPEKEWTLHNGWFSYQRGLEVKLKLRC